MDPESALRLKEEAIRLKVEAIELKLESIELKVEAFDLKLEAEESHPGIRSGEDSEVEYQPASVAALTWKQRRGNFLKNLYPRWGEDSEVEDQPASVAALTWEQRRDNFLKNLYPRWGIDVGYYEKSLIKRISDRIESDDPILVDVRSLLKNEGEKRAYDALGGGTVLHLAVRMEDLTLVNGILAAGEVDVNARDEVWRATALHWAARIGNKAIVKAMLTDHLASRKFDLRVRDRWGSTALECAIFNGWPNISMVIELLKFKDSDHGYDDREGVIGEVEEILQEGGSSTFEVERRFENQRETWHNRVTKEKETYLHWAVRMEDTALATHILKAGKIDVDVVDFFGRTALLLAVQSRNLDAVRVMVELHLHGIALYEISYEDPQRLQPRNFNVNQVYGRYGYSLLHWAIVSGQEENTDIVQELLRCEATMRLTEECTEGKTPLQLAHERGFKDIQKILMMREEVQRYVEDLYRDRQVYVDAANAILVGAALIASVTFASWLQPPLGYTPDYANVQQHVGLRAFWVFNCLSFYFAIATVVFGARSVLPRNPYFSKRMVEKLRNNLLMTTILLACSVFFVIIAFGIAGCIVLTPIVKFQLYMIIPTIFGGLVCLISLMLLSYSMLEDSLRRKHVARGRYEWKEFTENPMYWVK